MKTFYEQTLSAENPFECKLCAVTERIISLITVVVTLKPSILER